MRHLECKRFVGKTYLINSTYYRLKISASNLTNFQFAIVGGPINSDDTLGNHIVTPVTQQICGIKEYCQNTSLDNISQNNQQQQFNPNGGNNNFGINNNNNNNNGQLLYQPNTNFQPNLSPVSNNNYGLQQQQQYPTFNNINNNMNNGQLPQFDATTTSTCTSPYDQPYCYAYVTSFVQSQLQQNSSATAAVRMKNR